MPGFLVHLGATVLCSHGGSAQPTASDSRVLVNGQPVVTQPAPHTVAGCSMPPPPSGNGPCASASWTTAAGRVKASGLPVLLQDSQATCAPTGTPLIVTVTQTRVMGQ